MAHHIHGIGTDIHGDVCISVIDDAGAPVLLVTSPVSDNRSEEEAEKLARVAATGFDMLEALRMAHAELKTGSALQAVIEAIAKAEGKK